MGSVFVAQYERAEQPAENVLITLCDDNGKYIGYATGFVGDSFDDLHTEFTLDGGVSGTIVSPVKQGYEFAGWYDENGKLYDLDANSADGDITLYASWTEAEQPAPERYDYVLVNDDGSSIGTGVAYEGQKLSEMNAYFSGSSDVTGIFTAPEREGYEFVGWFGEDGKWIDIENTGASCDLTLVAHWEAAEQPAPALPKVTLVYEDENGDSKTSVYEVSEVDYKLPDTLEVSSILFDGDIAYWYSDKDGTRFTPEQVRTQEWSTDTTLIAHYEDKDEPDNPDNPGGGTNPDNPGGGTTDPDNPGTEDPVAKTHKVTFDDCLPSTENQVVEVKDGEPVAKPADPVCEGWKFEGWYSDTDLTQAWDFSTPVTEDMTLWAKWSQVEEPGTDEPGTDTPGTDEPGTTPEQPGDSTQTPGSGDQATGGTNESAIPNTGDATVAVSGIAGLGAALAGIGAFIRRRR